MKRWGVTLPITGSIYIEVEAESEKAAIDAALVADPGPWSDDLQWETHRRVVEGNVFYGTQNKAEAQEIDE